MNPSRRPPLPIAPLAILILACAAPAQACSVCFGDPNSSMSQAAVRGVFVLLGVIGLVLGGIATIGGCWIVRAARATPAHRRKSLFLAE